MFEQECNSCSSGKYLTIVLSLVSGAVVFIGDGKSADSLNPFWKKLKCILVLILKPWLLTCFMLYYEAKSTAAGSGNLIHFFFFVFLRTAKTLWSNSYNYSFILVAACRAGVIECLNEKCKTCILLVL